MSCVAEAQLKVVNQNLCGAERKKQVGIVHGVIGLLFSVKGSYFVERPREQHNDFQNGTIFFEKKRNLTEMSFSFFKMNQVGVKTERRAFGGR